MVEIGVNLSRINNQGWCSTGSNSNQTQRNEARRMSTRRVCGQVVDTHDGLLVGGIRVRWCLRRHNVNVFMITTQTSQLCAMWGTDPIGLDGSVGRENKNCGDGAAFYLIDCDFAEHSHMTALLHALKTLCFTHRTRNVRKPSLRCTWGVYFHHLFKTVPSLWGGKSSSHHYHYYSSHSPSPFCLYSCFDWNNESRGVEEAGGCVTLRLWIWHWSNFTTNDHLWQCGRSWLSHRRVLNAQ